MATYNTEDISGEAKARYHKKLKYVDLDCCTNQILSDAWKEDSTKWLEIEFTDIYIYLIETPDVFTREPRKNRKSREAHNQFITDWVRTAYHYQKNWIKFYDTES